MGKYKIGDCILFNGRRGIIQKKLKNGIFECFWPIYRYTTIINVGFKQEYGPPTRKLTQKERIQLVIEGI